MNDRTAHLAERPVDTQKRFTYDELVAAFPETNTSCELHDGQLLMSPTPSFFHQEITLRLCRALADWVEPRDLGKVAKAPIDMVLAPHHVTQPDVVFISKTRLHIIERVIMGPVDLAIEVISLGGRTRDRIEKRDLYEQYGIREFWLVDPEPQTVEVLCLNQERYELAQRARLGNKAASRLLPGFEIDVDYLFHGRRSRL